MSELADIEERLQQLRAASRPSEPLTDKRGATAAPQEAEQLVGVHAGVVGQTW